MTVDVQLCFLETLRVVNSNLPFRFGEYEESKLLSALTRKDEFRTTVNTSNVTQAVAELYHSGVTTVSKVLAENEIQGVASFAMNADFWISKTQGAKFLGLLLYLIDRNFMYQSILPGRAILTLAMLKKRHWIVAFLRDFGPSRTFLELQATKGLWSIPHLTNASAKTAFGITPQRSSSKNLEMTDLISRISKTINAVRSNEKLGSLFAELYMMPDPNATTKLLEYRDHRFMSLTSHQTDS
ncbi:hypothetical protein PHPALM_27955 [Phytophthora palmivora]|uniref:Uncharacterized protein n=1 Tax=Phytophthora palmivora TaxID=4796 RepID=A0A2P4XB85_9STRA|nr:hypothetical protein PHPALM_27955 [Phytophthora palmivora]